MLSNHSANGNRTEILESNALYSMLGLIRLFIHSDTILRHCQHSIVLSFMTTSSSILAIVGRMLTLKESIVRG